MIAFKPRILMLDDLKQSKNEKPIAVRHFNFTALLVWLIILSAVLLLFFKKNTGAKYASISRQTFNQLQADPTAEVTGIIHYPQPQSSLLCEITGHTSGTNGSNLPSGNFRVKTRLDDHLERTLLARGFDTVETNTTLMSILARGPGCLFCLDSPP
jgi:hypothetical protein